MSKTVSKIHRKHAVKLAREVANRQAQQAEPLSDDALLQAIEDCFGDDTSVDLMGAMSDDMDDLAGSDDALEEA